MPKIIRSDHAEVDLLEIWCHIAERNFSAANHLIDEVNTQAEILAQYPGAGPARNEIKPGLRSWPVGNYIIFYTRIEGGIAIQRVLHGARKIEDEFDR